MNRVSSLCILLLVAFAPPAHSGLVQRLIYSGIGGSDIHSLTSTNIFPSAPSKVEVLTNGLEAADSGMDNIGTYTRGYLETPQSGYYRFWISSDDASQLWICTNSSLPNPQQSDLTLACRCDAAVPFHSFTQRREQISGRIYLDAFQRYYFEVVHKEAGGGDHFSVAWQMPDATVEAPIRSIHLLPFPVDPDNGYRYRDNVPPTMITLTPRIAYNPPPLPGLPNPNDPQVPPAPDPNSIKPPTPPSASSFNRYPGVVSGSPPPMVVTEDDDVTFELDYEATVPLKSIRWRYWFPRNTPFYGANYLYQSHDVDKIPGAPQLSYYLWEGMPGGLGGMTGGGIVALIANAKGGTNSTPTPLIVVDDYNPPRVVRLTTYGNPAGIDVYFNERLAARTDESVKQYNGNNPRNYTLNIGSVTGAEYLTRRHVRLATTDFEEGNVYTVTIQNIWDDSQKVTSPNGITPTNITFLPVHGMITRKIFQPIGGTNLDDLLNHPKFQQDNPDVTDFPERLEHPRFEDGDLRDNYGVRLQGYITAPTNGAYVFALSSEGPSKFYLSTDSSPANKTLVGMEPAGAPKRAFANAGAGQSARMGANGPSNLSTTYKPITLETGKKYYFEAVMKAGRGSDHIEVAWQRPGDPAITNGTPSIGPEFLSAFAKLAPVEITRDPFPVSTVDHRLVTFNAVVDGSPPYYYQWFRNGEAIADANQSSYTFEATQEDGGAAFTVIVTNAFSSATSGQAALTVQGAPPTVTHVGGFLNSDKLMLSFDEPVSGTMGDPANYLVNDQPLVQTVSLRGGGRSAILSLSQSLTQPDVKLTLVSLEDLNLNTASNVVVNGKLSGMAAQDIGKPGDPASISQVFSSDGRNFDVTATGSDIWNNADGFNFISEQRQGDFDIQVRVQKLDAAEKWSKCGLMIREDLTPESRNHSVVVTASGQTANYSYDGFGADTYEANVRAAKGGGTARWVGTPPSQGPYVPFPNAWIRLQREGSILRSYRSDDGIFWELIAETSATYPDSVYVGLCTSARTNTRAINAEFRDYGNFGVVPVGDVHLTIRTDPAGFVVEWPVEATGWTLQHKFTLDPGEAWVDLLDSKTSNTYTFIEPQPFQFFRLKQ